MKKLVYITAIVLAVLLPRCFTGCRRETPPPQTPVVEIVERTNLLDAITTELVVSEEDRQRLAEKGITASIRNVQLTGSNAVGFDLLISGTDRTFTMPVQALLSYEKETVDGKDVFSEIQLYWGGFSVYEKEIAVINLTRLLRFYTDDLSAPHTGIDLSGVMGEGGYILSTAISQDNYAFLYHTPEEDGFAVFDEKGVMKEKVPVATDGCHLLKEAEKGSLPFDSSFTPAIIFTDDDILAAGQDSAWYYNTTEKILLSAQQPLVSAEKDGNEYGIYHLTAAPGYEGTTKQDLFLALKTASGSYSDSLFFDGGNLLGDLSCEKQLGVKAGTAVLKVPATGLEMDIDFSGNKVVPRYKIQPEMLGERLYISADRQYELYPMSDGNVTHIALKEISTGKIRFISPSGTLNQGMYEGETGFMADGRVYVLGNDDFRIYSTDMEALSPEYTLSDHIPLGKDINTDRDSRILVAADMTDDGRVFAVYYDDLYCENDADKYTDETKTRCKAAYQIAEFDRQGNITAVYDTGVNAFLGYCPVTMNIRGGRIYLTITHENTDHILTKGSLDLQTAVFKETQPYKPYQ